MLILFSVLRFLHIVAGILWAGGAIALSLFIAPTMGAIGDAGKQFAGHLMGKTKFTMYMTVTAATTVLAGSILYGIDSNWFQSNWMMTPTGIGFGIGSTAGLVAFVFGFMLGKCKPKTCSVWGADPGEAHGRTDGYPAGACETSNHGGSRKLVLHVHCHIHDGYCAFVRLVL
ncbi:MAG: hypothetical protein IPG80_20965 [Anaerolineales bacterium]|uniref:hypothetical protein n=1 Tax=Candidatus Villigracilis vicinus TaxID=3140679 RepID=UPI00313604F3|nr:hypothetical protein [Anaerolineales bacterium]